MGDFSQGYHQNQLQKFIIAEFDEQDLGPRNIFELLEITEGSKIYVCLDYLMEFTLEEISGAASEGREKNIFTVWLDLTKLRDQPYLCDYENWLKLVDLGIVVFDPGNSNNVRFANQILESLPI